MVNMMESIDNIPELLAPAGGIDQLKAAVAFGADAVYLSGQNFGMRARAANFTDNELPAAVAYAHSHNVKVYVTVNILMHQNDIPALKKYLCYLQKLKVDAFIISDLGAAKIAREVAPDVALHVSTQASVANSASAEIWTSLGASRVVLAREMSLTQIEQMSAELTQSKDEATRNLQLEAFVHGAMCMSVSGRCLISTYLTGRSANKGLCTQPCRWGFNLEEEKRPGQKFNINEDDFGTYIMNSKDMNMLQHLGELADAGISAFKIEGRNKKSMYVATTTNAYRHVIDSGFDAEAAKKWADELNTISHRPYSTGFYFGEAQQTPDYDGYEQECVHVADVVQAPGAAQQSDQRTTVLCRNHFEEGQTLEVIVPGEDIIKFTVKDLMYIGTQDNPTKNKKVDIANRAKELYTFECELPVTKYASLKEDNHPLLTPGSILRAREFLRTSRK